MFFFTLQEKCYCVLVLISLISSGPWHIWMNVGPRVREHTSYCSSSEIILRIYSILSKTKYVFSAYLSFIYYSYLHLNTTFL